MSADSLYEFENLEDEKRFYNLIQEVRWPKCTSGSLASSNAPVSEDLKQKIIELIKKGKTDKEIKDFLTLRFGNDVLYNPGFNQNTYFLWFAPVLFFIMGLIMFVIRKNK
jgi:cytochrome c-type biogenesis protein CcmH